MPEARELTLPAQYPYTRHTHVTVHGDGSLTIAQEGSLAFSSQQREWLAEFLVRPLDVESTLRNLQDRVRALEAK